MAKVTDYHRPRVHEHEIGRVTPIKGERKQVKWSADYDGRPVVELLLAHPKMSYAELLNVICNEEGTVDEQGIIHRKPIDMNEYALKLYDTRHARILDTDNPSKA